MVKKVLMVLMVFSVAALWGSSGDPEHTGKKASILKVPNIPSVHSYHAKDVDTVVALSENFDSGVFPPAGWAQYRTGSTSGPGWQLTTSYSHSGSYSVYHNDDDASGGENIKDWLVTPAIEIPANITSCELSFYTRTSYAPSWTIKRSLWVSTGSPDPADGDYVLLVDYSDSAWEYTFSQVTVDLSAFAGQTIYLAFYYEGDFSDEWYIDDVEVTYEAELRPDVLVVNDYYAPYYGEFFAYSLYKQGYTFDYFSTSDSGRAPTFDELSKYKAVIWTTGSSWSSGDSYIDDALDVVGDYINAGGNFWLSSQDYLYFISSTIPSWLPITDYSYDAYTSDIDVDGVPGSPIGDGLSFQINQDYTYNYIDALTPASDAQAEFAVGSDPIAVSRAGQKGSGSVFFNAFVFANIAPQEMQDTLVARVMNFFGITPHPEYYNAGIEWVEAKDVWENETQNISAKVVNYSPFSLYIPVVFEIYDQQDQIVLIDSVITQILGNGCDTVYYPLPNLPVGSYRAVAYTAVPADEDHSTDTSETTFKVAPILQAPFVDNLDNLDNWIVGGEGLWSVIQHDGYIEFTRSDWEEGISYIVARVATGDLFTPKLGFKWSTSSMEPDQNDWLYVAVSTMDTFDLDLTEWTIIDSVSGDEDWTEESYLLKDYGIDRGDTIFIMFFAYQTSNYDHAYLDSVYVCEGYIPNDAEIVGNPTPELWDSVIVDSTTGDTIPVFTGIIMTPSLTITNGGNPAGDPIISFRAIYKIFDPNGVLAYSQTRIYRGLRPGDTTTIYFPGFIPARSGEYRMVVTIRCPQDPMLNNNTFSTTFYVPPHKSAAEDNSIPRKLMFSAKQISGGSSITFGIPASGHVKLTVLDMSGRVVDVPVNGSFAAGYYSITWNAPHSGVYFFKLDTDFGNLSKRLVILK